MKDYYFSSLWFISPLPPPNILITVYLLTQSSSASCCTCPVHLSQFLMKISFPFSTWVLHLVFPLGHTHLFLFPIFHYDHSLQFILLHHTAARAALKKALHLTPKVPFRVRTRDSSLGLCAFLSYTAITKSVIHSVYHHPKLVGVGVRLSNGVR